MGLVLIGKDGIESTPTTGCDCAQLGADVRGDQAAVRLSEDAREIPGPEKLATEATALLGDAPKHRTTRIMVTLPEQAATDKDFLVRLLERGMDIARINCAHDDSAVWLKMIENLKEAQKTAGKSCRIYFDIAGPKIRVDAVSSEKEKPRLKVGDLFFLTADASFKDLKHYPAIVFSESLNLFDELKVDSPVILMMASWKAVLWSKNRKASSCR